MSKTKGGKIKGKTWISLLGVSLVPALYNLSFVGSMWNPYGQIDQLPVAVVNQDQAVTYQGKTLTIGQDMVDSMKESHDLNFQFVSSQEASKGLAEGDYYLVVTLPQDLSAKAATLLTDHPQQLTIPYETTAGRSMVASKMSETAMDRLKASVSESITQTYTQEIFSSMGELQTGLADASSGGADLAKGGQKAQEGAALLAEKLGDLTAGATKLTQGSSQLQAGLGTYTAGVSQVNEGAQSLSQGINQYTGGVTSLAQGAMTLDAKSSQLQAGVNSLVASNSQMAQIAAGSQALAQGLQSLADQTALSDSQAGQIAQVQAGLVQLQEGLASLSQSSSPSVDPSQIQALQQGLDQVGQAMGGLEASLAADQAAALGAVSQTAAYQSLTPEGQAEIQAALAGAGSQTAASLQTIAGTWAQLSPQVSGLLQMAQSSLGGLGQLTQMASQADLVLSGAQATIQSLSQGLSSVHTAASQQLVPAGQQLAAGTQAFADGLSQGSLALQEGTQAYLAGVSQISQGAQTLDANSGQLTAGAAQLASGSSQLQAASPSLVSGADQLTQGLVQAQEGSSQLSQGAKSLDQGLVTLSKGAQDLSDGLTKASNQLNMVSVKEDNATAISDPVALVHTDKDAVATNGIGMAPYMIGVSLMVVGLSANVIFEKHLRGHEYTDRWDWAKNKLMVNGAIASLASIVLTLALYAIGFRAAHFWSFFLVVLLGAWTLMAIVTALVGWDDRYGAFASLILLLIQAGSSGGSYPIELSPKIFQVMHPYLPMSHIVLGLRQAISLDGQVASQVLWLSICLLAACGLGLVLYRPKAQSSLQTA